MQAYDEVCKNVRNKNKVQNYKQYKCIYISRIYKVQKYKKENKVQKIFV